MGMPDTDFIHQNNYVYHTSGRSPTLSSSTLFHTAKRL